MKDPTKVSRALASGPLLVAAVLNQVGIDTEYVDISCEIADLSEIDLELIVSRVGKEHQVVCLSCMNNLLHLAILAAREIKHRFPDCRIVLAGPGPTGVSGDICKYFKFIDFVVEGEGEGKILGVLAPLISTDSGRSTEFKRQCQEFLERVKYTNGLVRELDQLPFPAYDLVSLSRYTAVGLTTARGCPYSCSFCDSPSFWGNTFRKRSIDSVLSEMALLEGRYGIDHLFLWDDTFTVGRRRALQFCAEKQRASVSATFSIYGRVDEVDEDFLCDLRQAGCTNIFLGVESGSNRVLKQISKGITIEQAEESIDLISRLGFRVALGFIWGFPFESMFDFEETVSFIERKKSESVSVRFVPLNPCANAPIYQMHRDQLELIEEFQPYLIPFKDDMVAREVWNLVRKYPTIFPNFYGIKSENWLRKLQAVQRYASVDPYTYRLQAY